MKKNFTQFKITIKVPPDITAEEKAGRIKGDLELITTSLICSLPEKERKNVKVIDGQGVVHKFQSVKQLTDIYQRDGKIAVSYVGNYQGKNASK